MLAENREMSHKISLSSPNFPLTDSEFEAVLALICCFLDGSPLSQIHIVRSSYKPTDLKRLAGFFRALGKDGSGSWHDGELDAAPGRSDRDIRDHYPLCAGKSSRDCNRDWGEFTYPSSVTRHSCRAEKCRYEIGWPTLEGLPCPVHAAPRRAFCAG